MLDIIPYVNVTVKVHVLLFKPRVGAKLGARLSLSLAAHRGGDGGANPAHTTACAAAPLVRRRRAP
jgi:hypothetical protein